MIVITWTNLHQKVAGMGALAARVPSVHAHKWGTDVGEKIEQSVRGTIMDGGINPTAKGGPRVQTRAMLGSNNYEVTTAGTYTNVKGGFIDSPPDHALFQERGTLNRRIDSKKPRLTPTKGGSGSGGIPPMLAVAKAQAEIAIEGKKQGVDMLTNIATEWRTMV